MLLMSDKSNIQRFYLDIPRDAHRRLQYAAFLRGVSMKQIVLDCIERLPEPPKEERADRLTAPPADSDPSA